MRRDENSAYELQGGGDTFNILSFEAIKIGFNWRMREDTFSFLVEDLDSFEGGEPSSKNRGSNIPMFQVLLQAIVDLQYAQILKSLMWNLL